MANKITVTQFDDIARGTTLTIPVLIKRLDETPFDLTGYTAHFTLKPEKFDYDYDDDRALIVKDIEPTEEQAVKGRFNIVLTSKDTWLTPGEYHFDIELVHEHGVARLVTCNTEIVGGPTNRTVYHDEGHIFFSDCIKVVMKPNQPLVFITNLVSDPPENMIETIDVDPPYILEELNDPVRDVKLSVFGPRLSLSMVFDVPHDAEEHFVPFYHFFHHELPECCPFKKAKLGFKNTYLRFYEFEKKMDVEIYDMYVQHSPIASFDGHSGHLTTDDYWVVGDNVDVGNIHIVLHEGNDYVDITGHYYMEDDHGGWSHWVFTVNWYNWVDMPEANQETDEP